MTPEPTVDPGTGGEEGPTEEPPGSGGVPPGGRMTADTLFADRYRLERRLGTGGMATVQLALDTRLERHVAVKLLAEHLAQDSNFVSRFRREALAAARLVHPNIVQVFDFGAEEGSGRNFIVMEFVDGPSCADILQGARPARPRGRRLDPHPGLPRARLRAPQRRRAPRRQARQPAAQPRRRAGQARRLRHRQGGRALRHDQGRLRARHGRLPLARAGARRAGRPAQRPLRARRRLLPAARRPAAVRVDVADRARAPAGHAGADAAARARPRRSRGRSRSSWRARSSALPEDRFADAGAMEQALTAAMRGVAPEPTAATRALDDTEATRMLDRTSVTTPLARTQAAPRPAPPDGADRRAAAAQQAARRPPAPAPRAAGPRAARAAPCGWCATCCWSALLAGVAAGAYVLVTDSSAARRAAQRAGRGQRRPGRAGDPGPDQRQHPLSRAGTIAAPVLLGSPKMDRVPDEERADFPRLGARARCLARFERDLERWLRTPEGRFAQYTAAQSVAEPAPAERR